MREAPVNQITIHVSALERNYRRMAELVGSGVEVAAVVKANAYGHGIETASRAFYQAGCRRFCVATVEEGADLRSMFGHEIAIHKTIPSLPEEFEDVYALGLEETIASVPQLHQWEGWLGERGGASLVVHLKFDCGMGRLGCKRSEFLELWNLARSGRRFKTAGVMSHLPASEEDGAPNTAETRAEINRFKSLVNELKTVPGTEGPRFHLANSGGALYHPESRFDLVRTGLALYGVDPRGTDLSPLGFEPALEFTSRLIQIRKIQAGETIGYGRAFRAGEPMVIGVAPVGYGEGLRWNPESRGEVLVRGRRRRILGRFSMNLSSIDLTGVGSADPGEPVTIIGEQGNERITVEDLASSSGTIPYETLVGLGPGVLRRAVDTRPAAHESGVA